MAKTILSRLEALDIRETKVSAKWNVLPSKPVTESKSIPDVSKHVAGKITCLYVNARSLLNKLDQMASLLVEEEPTIAIICETWTHEGIGNAEISFSGYNILVRKDRLDTQNGRGGGLLMLVREGNKASEINTKSEFHQLGGR